MSTRITEAAGADIVDFYLHHWPGEDWYYTAGDQPIFYELDEEETEETAALDPAKIYSLKDFGYLCWQGPESKEPQEDRLFADVFAEWKDNQTSEKLVLHARVPRGTRDSVLAALAATVVAHGGQVET